MKNQLLHIISTKTGKIKAKSHLYHRSRRKENSRKSNDCFGTTTRQMVAAPVRSVTATAKTVAVTVFTKRRLPFYQSGQKLTHSVPFSIFSSSDFLTPLFISTFAYSYTFARTHGKYHILPFCGARRRPRRRQSHPVCLQCA